MAASQLNVGDSYNRLKPVVVIFFLVRLMIKVMRKGHEKFSPSILNLIPIVPMADGVMSVSKEEVKQGFCQLVIYCRMPRVLGMV